MGLMVEGGDRFYMRIILPPILSYRLKQFLQAVQNLDWENETNSPRQMLKGIAESQLRISRKAAQSYS